MCLNSKTNDSNSKDKAYHILQNFIKDEYVNLYISVYDRTFIYSEINLPKEQLLKIIQIDNYWNEPSFGELIIYLATNAKGNDLLFSEPNLDAVNKFKTFDPSTKNSDVFSFHKGNPTSKMVGNNLIFKGPYLKVTKNNEKIRIPLKGNPSIKN